MQIQVVDLPKDIFAEAQKASQRIEGSDTGILTVAKRGSEASDGLTAEILNMAVLDAIQLSIPHPRVTHRSIPFLNFLCLRLV